MCCWWWYHGISPKFLRLLPLAQGQWPNGKNKASLGPFSQYLNIDPARPIEAALIVEPALATEPALAE